MIAFYKNRDKLYLAQQETDRPINPQQNRRLLAPYQDGGFVFRRNYVMLPIVK